MLKFQNIFRVCLMFFEGGGGVGTVVGEVTAGGVEVTADARTNLT